MQGGVFSGLVKFHHSNEIETVATKIHIKKSDTTADLIPKLKSRFLNIPSKNNCWLSLVQGGSK